MHTSLQCTGTVHSSTCTSSIYNVHIYMYMHLQLYMCNTYVCKIYTCIIMCMYMYMQNLMQHCYSTWLRMHVYNHSGTPCAYKGVVCQTSYVYSLLIRANKLETAVQGSLPVWPHQTLFFCMIYRMKKHQKDNATTQYKAVTFKEKACLGLDSNLWPLRSRQMLLPTKLQKHLSWLSPNHP